MTLLCLSGVMVSSKESAEAFKTLMEASSKFIRGFGEIDVLGAIGGEGWKALAEGVRLHPGFDPEYVSVLKDDLDEASREDIRVIWDALKTDGQFSVGVGGGEGGRMLRRQKVDGPGSPR